VFIGAGVELGDGCVVSAGSVVSRSLPAGSVAVGVPARIVRRREDYGERDGDAGSEEATEGREAAAVAAETE
jgi:acetyltransferase-like isoleucine patch superfamily enzyme